MIKLIHGDCLVEMNSIPDKSIDMILCDLPYGVTACKWDVVIPFDSLWEQYKRVIKKNGAIVLFGSEPFSSHLRMSNLKMFKYDWIWDKKKGSGHLNAKKMPLRQHELISVFGEGKLLYNPQGTISGNFANSRPSHGKTRDNFIWGSIKEYAPSSIGNYPKTILSFSNPVNKERRHPTQKPVPLLEYLIKTYTNEGELVLDNCMGSGSTGVACKNLNRKFIGIEKEEKCFKIAEDRIKNHENFI